MVSQNRMSSLEGLVITVTNPKNPDDEYINGAPDKFVCPLTLELYKEPVMDKNGITFEKSAIMTWLQKGGESCPLTRRPLKVSDLVPDSNLKYQVDSWRHQQEQRVLFEEETPSHTKHKTTRGRRKTDRPVSLEDLTNYHVSVDDLTEEEIQFSKYIMGVRFPKQRTVESWGRKFRKD